MAKFDVEIDAKKLAQLKKQGYIRIPFMDEERAAALSKEILFAFQNKGFQDYVWVDQLNCDHRVFGLENASSLVSDVKAELDRFLEACYGQKIESTTLCQNVVATKDNHGSGGYFHRDAQRQQFKAFLYLTPTDQKSGALQIVKNSHKLASKFLDCLNQKRVRLDITKPTQVSDDQIETISASIGDVLICNTSCIHRGSPGLESDRINLTVYGYPMNKIPGHVKDSMLPS